MSEYLVPFAILLPINNCQTGRSASVPLRVHQRVRIQCRTSSKDRIPAWLSKGKPQIGTTPSDIMANPIQ